MAQSPAFGAIWDMDGTLVDTAELHFAAWTEVCRERGLPFTRADFVATFGWRNPEILRKLFGNQLTDADANALAERKEELYREAARRIGIEPLPGVRELLTGLRHEGIRQAVGSSAPRKNLDLILEVAGLAEFFEALSSMEDTTRGKPDPEVFLIAAQRLGLEPKNCLVLEDAIVGVQAARAGGMKCIAVSFAGHHPAEKLRNAGANLVVGNLKDVPANRVLELLTEGEL